MGDVDAGTPGNAVQVVPPDAEFRGPFAAITKSVHTMTNTSARRICLKIKVFDNSVIQSKPTCVFLTPGQQVLLTLQHNPFQHNPAENYSKRKIGLFYVEAPDSAADCNVLAKETPAANWKVVKMLVKYNAGGAPAPAVPALPAGAAPVEAPPAS